MIWVSHSLSDLGRRKWQATSNNIAKKIAGTHIYLGLAHALEVKAGSKVPTLKRVTSLLHQETHVAKHLVLNPDCLI